MDVYSLIRPFGILTYLVVFLAVITGLFLRRLHLKLKHHKTIALVALAVATLHGVLVVILALA